jgi:hypothetical protein
MRVKLGLLLVALSLGGRRCHDRVLILRPVLARHVLGFLERDLVVDRFGAV